MNEASDKISCVVLVDYNDIVYLVGVNSEILNLNITKIF